MPLGAGGVGRSRNWKFNAIASGIFIIIVMVISGITTYHAYVEYSRVQNLQKHRTTVSYTITGCTDEKSRQSTWTCSGWFDFDGKKFTTGLSGWPRNVNNPAPSAGTVTRAVIDPATPDQYAYVLTAVRGPMAVSSWSFIEPALIGSAVVAGALAISIGNHRQIMRNVRGA